MPHLPTPEGVSIGPAVARDVLEFAALMSLVNPDETFPLVATLQALTPQPGPFPHGHDLCLTARAGDRVVGALLGAPPTWATSHPLAPVLAPRVLAIGGLAVHPDHRGRGIASALLREAERRCRQTPLRLLTGEHPPELTGFYTRRGYTAGQERLIVTLPDDIYVRKTPGFLAAAKPLAPDMNYADMPGAPARVITGLLPGCHIPPGTRYDQLTPRPPADA